MKMGAFAFLITVVLLFGCRKIDRQDGQAKMVHNVSMEYTETFESVGFSITTPCKLRDVSAQASGDFLINYGGIENPNSESNLAIYQLMVVNLPVGIRDVPKDQLDEFLDKALRDMTVNLLDVKQVKFGYEDYPGYVGYASHNGLKQKGIVFLKDDYIICLTLMTNDNLEARFNKFTNGFKTLSRNPTKLILNSQESDNVSKPNSNLSQRFSNSNFSFYYPQYWSIVQKDVRVTSQTTIAVQVMAQNVNAYDFAPNVNVIVSTNKHTEPTAVLARAAFNQVKESGISCRLIDVSDCNLNGSSGSVVEYTAVVQGFTLRIWQYIIKKNDNTTFTVTATIDNADLSLYGKLVHEIVNTFVIR